MSDQMSSPQDVDAELRMNLRLVIQKLGDDRQADGAKHFKRFEELAARSHVPAEASSAINKLMQNFWERHHEVGLATEEAAEHLLGYRFKSVFMAVYFCYYTALLADYKQLALTKHKLENNQDYLQAVEEFKEIQIEMNDFLQRIRQQLEVVEEQAADTKSVAVDSAREAAMEALETGVEELAQKTFDLQGRIIRFQSDVWILHTQMLSKASMVATLEDIDKNAARPGWWNLFGILVPKQSEVEQVRAAVETFFADSKQVTRIKHIANRR